MANEYEIFDSYSGAEERVAGNFAIPPDLDVALDFNKCADPAPVTHAAAVQIHQIRLIDNDTLSEFYVGSDHAFGFRLFMSRKLGKHFSGQRNRGSWI
jgi:hypothetical protein